MPTATLITTAAVAGLLVMAGCLDRTVETPPTAPERAGRSARIWVPGAAPPSRDIKPKAPAESVSPEPAMSIPPKQDVAPSPAAAPAPRRRAPRDAPPGYRDRCGRPLIT